MWLQCHSVVLIRFRSLRFNERVDISSSNPMKAEPAAWMLLSSVLKILHTFVCFYFVIQPSAVSAPSYTIPHYYKHLCPLHLWITVYSYAPDLNYLSSFLSANNSLNQFQPLCHCTLSDTCHYCPHTGLHSSPSCPYCHLSLFFFFPPVSSCSLFSYSTPTTCLRPDISLPPNYFFRHITIIRSAILKKSERNQGSRCPEGCSLSHPASSAIILHQSHVDSPYLNAEWY